MIPLLLVSCNNQDTNSRIHNDTTGFETHTHKAKVNQYVCSMFCDSLIYDKPGKCKICGMDLIKKEEPVSKVYTCPMHPEIIRDKPGQCPICGMDLVEKGMTSNTEKLNLGAIIEPVNETIIGEIKTTIPVVKTIAGQVSAKGYISYNPKNSSAISSRYSGRIDKLYVKYNFQEVIKGQKIMDIYSPELLTAQQDYVFLLNNNEEDMALIQSTRQKLMLLGMNEAQVQNLSKTRKIEYLVSIYAPSSGHIHKMGLTMSVNKDASMDNKQTELSIREGMYIKKGEVFFNLISLTDLWVILKIYPQDAGKVKIGQSVKIVSEMAPDNALQEKISFIEPVLEKDSKFISVRVYLEKCDHHIFKIGSLVNASIDIGEQKGLWIPSSAILDLGNESTIVFKQEGGHFKTYKVSIGNKINKEVNILEGLNEQDVIASDAWYLVDSESFVSTK